jgi:hypothetical protein
MLIISRFQSKAGVFASPNHIEAALRDVHMKAPNSQQLIVILPDVTDGMCILEKFVLRLLYGN